MMSTVLRFKGKLQHLSNIPVRIRRVGTANGIYHNSLFHRCLSTGNVNLGDISDSWLSKLLVRKIEPTKESHSRMLSDKEIIYSLHTDNIKPSATKEYYANFKKRVELVQSRNELSCELVGSWQVELGDLDQCIHLWRYKGGYEKVDQNRSFLKNDTEYSRLLEEQSNYIRSRHLQYLLAFSFWPSPTLREENHIYEIRSYSLKPGTMIEWGNNWARAINFRRHSDEAFAGFFSQIGRLYNVHHIWCYKNLQERKEIRESAWRSPGWDECVAYTVPLIREMHSRVLVPTEISPTK